MKRIAKTLALIGATTLLYTSNAVAGVHSCEYDEGIVTYIWNCGEYRDSKTHDLVYPICGIYDSDSGECSGEITGPNQCCG